MPDPTIDVRQEYIVGLAGQYDTKMRQQALSSTLPDAARLMACLGGAFVGVADPGCAAADFNGDGDVDFGDYAAWFDCVSGPGTESACGC